MIPLTTDQLDCIWEDSTRDKIPVGSDVRCMVAEIRRWRGEAWAAAQRPDGMEGAVIAALRERSDVACDAECNGDLGRHDSGCIRATAILAALATTSSPDASPDSGEAEEVALLMEALNNPEPIKIGEGEYAYAKVEELPAMLRGMVSDGLFFQCEPHVTIDAWNIARMAADELEARLAASPASLSGGAEEPWHTDLGGLLEARRVMRQAYKAIETAKAQNTHIPGNPYDVALSSLNPALASLDTLIVSHPSPEAPADTKGLVARLLGHADYDEDMSDALRASLRDAAAALSPANRQEAGEVAIWSGEHRAYWRRGSRGEGANYTLNLDEAGIWTREEAAKLTSHCGPEKLIALHDRPTLTSPKDVKGGGR